MSERATQPYEGSMADRRGMVYFDARDDDALPFIEKMRLRREREAEVAKTREANRPAIANYLAKLNVDEIVDSRERRIDAWLAVVVAVLLLGIGGASGLCAIEWHLTGSHTAGMAGAGLLLVGAVLCFAAASVFKRP